MPEPWRPRASALGTYFQCDYRAAFDRAIESGEIVLAEEAKEAVEGAKKSSPRADFGTCTHFTLQGGIGCVFPGPTKDFAPDPEQWTNASVLHGGDVEKTKAAAISAATMAAKAMPVAPDGKPWLAEAAFKTRHLQGHIDFLSQDYTEIGDLKTTGRPPPRNQPKVEHVIQLCAYAVLVRAQTGVTPKRGWLLYQDVGAEWSLLVPVDFQTDGMVEFIGQVGEYAKYLCTKKANGTAIPRMGSHCSDNWCPYTTICRARIMPRADAGHHATKPAVAMPSARIKGL